MTPSLEPQTLPPQVAGKDKTLVVLIGILAIMVSLVAASPYLYDLFCRVTGYGGTAASVLTDYERPTGLISGLAAHERPYQMTVEARVAGDAPIAFTTTTPRVENFHIGQRVMLEFSVTNTSDTPILAQALHQIHPPIIAANMLVQECFCTSEQALEPGVTYDYALVMLFDPAAAGIPDVLREQSIQVRYEYLQKP